MKVCKWFLAVALRYLCVIDGKEMTQSPENKHEANFTSIAKQLMKN